VIAVLQPTSSVPAIDDRLFEMVELGHGHFAALLAIPRRQDLEIEQLKPHLSMYTLSSRFHVLAKPVHGRQARAQGQGNDANSVSGHQRVIAE
jgi:hypothetical protein